MAEIIAKIHLSSSLLQIEPTPEYSYSSNSDLELLLVNAKIILNYTIKRILQINTAYIESMPSLVEKIVLSHGDLDQKNVVWDKACNPYLIDWESSPVLNPNHEILAFVLDWSGITIGKFNYDCFKKNHSKLQN